MTASRNRPLNSHFSPFFSRNCQSKATFSIMLAICLLASRADAKYSGGTGEPNNPYRIADANDLNDIGNHVEDFNKCFVMVNDINLAEYTGTQFNTIDISGGVFDGNNHTISNYSSAGPIFGLVQGADAEIKDLGLTDPNIDTEAGGPVGSLVRGLWQGRVSGCYVDGGRVSGSLLVGGLVGENELGEIWNCYATADVCSVNGKAGGLVGGNTDGRIMNCYATGSVEGIAFAGGLVGICGGSGVSIISNCYSTGCVSGGEYTGGLVGLSDSSTISDCYAIGPVDGNESTGGLVGNDCEGTISHCYATGAVSGQHATGGLVGLSDWSTVSDCYATGPVDGNSHTGGLVGWFLGRKISNCYAAGAVDGNDYTGGLVGLSGRAGETTFVKCFWDSDVNPDVNGIGYTTDPNVIGKTTAEMMQEATFVDWDFIEIWNIGENQTYPFLRVYPAGDLNHDGRVDLFDFGILAGHWLEGVE